MSDRVRYGYYLRPSAEMCEAQVRVHRLLEHQYGLKVAGKFMPHCTIKGFFKSGRSETDICNAAASISYGIAPFPVFNNGLGSGKLATTLSIMFEPDGSRNGALQTLHQRAIDVLLPLVSEDCNFTADEDISDRFHAHLTLAMADIPVSIRQEVVEFCQELEPVGPRSFKAERLHLYAFESPDWDGEWWRDFRWRLIESWRLVAQ